MWGFVLGRMIDSLLEVSRVARADVDRRRISLPEPLGTALTFTQRTDTAHIAVELDRTIAAAVPTAVATMNGLRIGRA